MEEPAETFLWYDLETSGTSPAHDRIVQFASLRTDADLTPVEPPFSTYVQLGSEVVPWPESLLVTGIAPQTLASGLPEWEAMTEILRIFETPRTCVVGYNNLLFDDEFIRYTLYRNLLDPYAREWRDGNSRWDIMDLVRAAGALRPEGIEWPVVEGKPAFGLQAIADVNGLSHKQSPRRPVRRARHHRCRRTDPNAAAEAVPVRPRLAVERCRATNAGAVRT